MIIWVCFLAGAGGDGIANLLEQASNARQLDKNKSWRIHRYVNNQVKFYAPTVPINSDSANSRNNPIEMLDDYQVKIANSDTEYLIITSDNIWYTPDLLYTLVPSNKQIKILVTSKNSRYNYLTKNLIEFNMLTEKIPIVVPGGPRDEKAAAGAAAAVIDHDNIVDNWEYIKKFTLDIGLDLTQEDFNNYIKIVTGELIHHQLGIEHYKSITGIDNIVRYSKLN